jgi:predicted permease
MSFHPATTKVIKEGRSKTPFLLFFGNRKQDDSESAKQLTTMLISVLLVLVVTILGICIYAFLTGKLG